MQKSKQKLETYDYDRELRRSINLFENYSKYKKDGIQVASLDIKFQDLLIDLIADSIRK